MNSALITPSGRLSPGQRIVAPKTTAIVFAALVAIGLIAALLGGRRGWRGGARSPQLSRLCRAIVGADRRAIAAALGPPSTRTMQDDTWYYAIDPRRRLALAIDFVQGIARQTHVLRAPQR